MLCNHLTLLCSSDARGVRNVHVNSFHPDALVRGARMTEEPHLSCSMLSYERYFMHLGKDNAIHDFLCGGNGFPAANLGNVSQETQFDLGATQEVRDMRSLKVWQRDLGQCVEDRKRGATA